MIVMEEMIAIQKDTGHAQKRTTVTMTDTALMVVIVPDVTVPAKVMKIAVLAEVTTLLAIETGTASGEGEAQVTTIVVHEAGQDLQ